MNSKKTVTLSIDEKTYEEYKKYCEENGLVLSKRVEFFMKDELNKKGGKKWLYTFISKYSTT